MNLHRRCIAVRQGRVEAVWPVGRLPDLLAASDFVVIAAPHTPQTEKLFRRPQLQQMKPTAYLINIGRGAIVDLSALVAALEAGELAGAGLDVFEHEPNVPSDYLELPNVVLSPHVAGYSEEASQQLRTSAVRTIADYLTGKPAVNVVN